MTSKKPEFIIKKNKSTELNLCLLIFNGEYLDLNRIDNLIIEINKIDARILNSFKTVKFIDQKNKIKKEKIRGSSNKIQMNKSISHVAIESKDIDKIKKVYLKKNGKLILGQKIQHQIDLKRIVLVFDLNIDNKDSLVSYFELEEGIQKINLDIYYRQSK